MKALICALCDKPFHPKQTNTHRVDRFCSPRCSRIYFNYLGGGCEGLPSGVAQKCAQITGSARSVDGQGAEPEYRWMRSGFMGADGGKISPHKRAD